MKRTISFLLALVLTLGMVPFHAMALEPVAKFETETDTYINPLYADVITEDDLVQPCKEPHAELHADPVYATTFAEAGVQMRQPMVNREETIVVYYQTTNYASSQHKDIFNAAVAHTGNPDEGDALRWVYAGYSVRIGRSVRDGISYVTYTYTMTYYTTAEQEAELEEAMDALLATVDPNGTDYERFCTVYDYICENIVYDYDTLQDNDYKLKYTAYAAMINGTAVCQGYAVLLYQLALELGIDCRVITGIGNNGGHGWNIVKFGDYYYNTDPTWDAIWYQELGYYNYFLQNEVNFTSNFTDHFRDAEYDTTEFHALYPISETNFEPEIEGGDSDYIGDGLIWELDDEGTLFITGYGEMIDYDLPWLDRSSEITYVVIDEGVTKIGASAFAGCENLSIIAFLGDAPAFGDHYVFEGVSAYAFYPTGNTTWTADVLLDYGGDLYWSPLCLNEHEWDGWVTVAEPTCEENGVKIRGCVYCDEQEEEQIPAIGHNYLMSDVDPTCTEQGYTVCTCIYCGDSYFDGYVDALGHDYKTVVTESTCTEAGYATHTCSACGDTYTETIPAQGHSYDAVVTAPTCTEAGYTTYTCACGDSYVADEVAALGHHYESVTVKPACTEDGLITYTCACGDSYTEVIKAKGHDYKATVTAPTCTEAGYTTYTCAACGDTYIADEVAALGHAYKAEVTKPTCTEGGYTTYTCSACGDSYVDDRVNAKGHSYKAVVTEPTCTEGGYTTYTCSVCGDSYVDDQVDALGHSYEDNVCTGCGETAIDAPVIKASNKASTGKISLTWEAVEGAEKYEVYRATSKTGTYSRMKTLTNTTYTNTTAKVGKYYYYYVRAIDADGNYADSNIVGRTCDLAQTTVTVSNVASTGKIKVSWEAVEGATKYEVYRATSKSGTYSRITTTANTSITNTKTDAGKTYYYKVRAICDVDAAAAAYSAIKSRTCDLPRPTVSIALSSGKPKVSWAKVDGAVEYKVYRATSKSGTYSLMKTTTSLSYKNTSATAGKTYYYKVVAVCSNTAGNSAYSSIVSIKSK